jgi:sulfite reductase alpha subunit-like flavoprotein
MKRKKDSKQIFLTLSVSALVVIGGLWVNSVQSRLKPKPPASFVVKTTASNELAVSQKQVAEKVNLHRKIITASSTANAQAIAAIVSQQGGLVLSQSANNVVVELPPNQAQAIEEQLTARQVARSVEVDYPIHIAADVPDWGVVRMRPPLFGTPQPGTAFVSVLSIPALTPLIPN